MKNNKKKGFTLVELLVVIAIIAILATVSVVGYLGFTEKAKESKCLSEATQARDAIVAALVDGEETDKSGAKKFTLENNTLTGDAANIKDVFGLNDLTGDFTLSNATKTFTYKVDGYTATFTLDGSKVNVAKATSNK